MDNESSALRATDLIKQAMMPQAYTAGVTFQLWENATNAAPRGKLHLTVTFERVPRRTSALSMRHGVRSQLTKFSPKLMFFLVMAGGGGLEMESLAATRVIANVLF